MELGSEEYRVLEALIKILAVSLNARYLDIFGIKLDSRPTSSIGIALLTLGHTILRVGSAFVVAILINYLVNLCNPD